MKDRIRKGLVLTGCLLLLLAVTGGLGLVHDHRRDLLHKRAAALFIHRSNPLQSAQSRVIQHLVF